MDKKEQTIEPGAVSLQAMASCPRRYKVKAMVGQGGMGMVFRAYDQELQRDVALKVLLFEGLLNEELLQRFFREAQTLAALNHINIVKIFSSGENGNGNPYHVMEWLEGYPLSRRLSSGPLQGAQFYELFCQVLSGLEYAHQCKVVHRDIKPSNIMICEDDDGSISYKIIDFGIARNDASMDQTGGKLTRTRALLGSPAYMSPEQCRGERGSFASDIYSLGCIMYECVAGTPPFLGESSFETMNRHILESPLPLCSPKNSPRSNRLAGLIERCLQKKPEERPQSASEIKAELTSIFSGSKVDIDLFSRPPARVAKRKKVAFVGLACATLLLSLAGATGLFLLLNPSSHEKLLPRTSEQEKVSAQINKLKVKVQKWRSVIGDKPGSAREHYLTDLFALGRQELKSTLPQDQEDAEKVFSEALNMYSGDNQAARMRRGACYVARAKSRWLQGKYAESDSDFSKAIQEVSIEKNEINEPYLDIMLQRPLLRIHTHRYEDALSDYLVALRTFERSPGNHTFLEITRFDQSLDILGDDRCIMTRNIAVELRKMKPRSESEAIQMIKLAHCLARSLSRIRDSFGALETLTYANSLLKETHGHSDLVRASRELHDYICR